MCDSDDDVLKREVMLCHGESVMLTCLFCVEAGLSNGEL